LIATIASLKLLISAVVPASFDLRDIVAYSSLKETTQLGPWITLESWMVGFWRSITVSTSTIGWGVTPPPAMSTDFRLLSLLIRLPTFLFDLAVAFILYYTVTKLASPHEGKLAFLLWFINPYTIFAVEMLGVPDIVATFLTLTAVTLLLEDRKNLASVFLAAGIALKLFPILLVPAFLLYRKERSGFRSQALTLLVVLVGLFGYISWLFPSGSYNLEALNSYSPDTQPIGSLFVFLAGSSSRNLSAAPIVLIALYFGMWLFAKKALIVSTIIPILLVYYVFSNPYPQYFLWALPFQIIDITLIKRRRVLLLATLLVLVLGSTFFASSGYLTPSGYSLLLIPLVGKHLPWYSQMLNSFLQSSVNRLLLPLLFSALYAVALIYALEVVRGWFVHLPENESIREK
jgi:hypothetical protein